MTTENPPSVTKKVDDVEARAMFAADAAVPVSLGQYWQGYLNKLPHFKGFSRRKVAQR